MARVVVTGLFGLFAVVAAESAWHAVARAFDGGSVALWAVAAYELLRLGVVVAFTVFVAIRSEPLRPAREPIAFVSCAVAITAIVLLRRPDVSADTLRVVVGDGLAAAAEVWLLASVVVLGRSFGVLPEARALVTRGPYRLVRHPVYLGEIGAVSGFVVAAPSAWNIAAAAVFVVSQLVRMRLEERALSEAFAEYPGYAARTPRLIPRLLRRGGGAVSPRPAIAGPAAD